MFSQHELVHVIATYGYWVLAFVIALECLGLPIPGETFLIAAAIYAGSHDLNIWLVIAAAAIGAVSGNIAGYWIGRKAGYRLLLKYGRRLQLTEGRLKLGQYLFLCHGGKIIFFSRFIAVTRVFAALFAGANHMSWPSFILFSIAGAIVWAIVVGAGAFYLEEEVHLFTQYAGIGAGLVAVIVIAAAVFFFRRHEARLQSEAERALPGPLRLP